MQSMSSLRLRRLFHFGKGRTYLRGPVQAVRAQPLLGDELKLFAGTFAAGFLFVTVYFS
ncbi:hypothetical protein ABDK56_04155 [Sphingomonas sp. ASV193]|uniref:hypothetical protein n=1 Tax=Sphingomonas sp. ASV193 TaxID=3144405 RepID=UPI0032E914C3